MGSKLLLRKETENHESLTTRAFDKPSLKNFKYFLFSTIKSLLKTW